MQLALHPWDIRELENELFEDLGDQYPDLVCLWQWVVGDDDLPGGNEDSNLIEIELEAI